MTAKKSKAKKRFAKMQLADNAGDLWKSFSVIALAVLTALGAAGAVWAGMEDVVSPFWFRTGVALIGFAGLVGRYVKQPTVSE